MDCGGLKRPFCSVCTFSHPILACLCLLTFNITALEQWANYRQGPMVYLMQAPTVRPAKSKHCFFLLEDVTER